MKVVGVMLLPSYCTFASCCTSFAPDLHYLFRLPSSSVESTVQWWK